MKLYLPFFLALATMSNAIATETDFENPIFSHLLYQKEDMENPTLLKRDGLRFLRDNEYLSCYLNEDNGSNISFLCLTNFPGTYGGFNDHKLKYDREIKFYSIGKDKKGFCQIVGINTSVDDPAAYPYTFATQGTDCGATEAYPKFDYRWQHAPKHKFTSFKNPQFNQKMEPMDMNTGRHYVTPTSFYETRYKEKTPCILFKNEETEIVFECNPVYGEFKYSASKTYIRFRLGEFLERRSQYEIKKSSFYSYKDYENDTPSEEHSFTSSLI